MSAYCPEPKKLRSRRQAQEGVVLLEALIGILIFSLGVLALVAMQAISISNVSNAQYRSEAAFLANEIIGAAWIDRGVSSANLDNYVYPGGTSPTVANWIGNRVNPLLPQAAAFPPTIQVNPVVDNIGAREVIVTLRWRAPDAITTSSHVAIAYISEALTPTP